MPIRIFLFLPDILFHWHTDIEIIYVSEGTAQFHIDYEYFDSQAGDIILIRPNALHSIHPIQRATHTMDVLHFNLDLVGISHKNIATLKYLQPLYNGDFEFARRIQPDAPGYEEIKSCLLDCMKSGRDQGPFYELRIKSQLNELLYLLYSHHYIVEKKFSTEAYRREEKIRLVLDHISDHYQEELMIEQLAELCNFSPTHFMNFFKKQLGISCMEYIIQFRLKKAAHLLQHSDQAIIEIASQSGFNNLSNFNRQFKKYYETTPSHYRKACL